MTTPNAPTNPAQAPDVGSPGDVAPDALDQLAGAGRAAHAATPALVTPGILAELDAAPATGLWPKSVATIDSVEQDALDLAEAATERLASSRLAIHRLEEEVRKLRSVIPAETYTCVWCGKVVLESIRVPAAREQLLAHHQACLASPLVQEVNRLRSDAEAYRWHQEQLASSDRRLADVENMRADLAARHVRQGEELANVEHQLDSSTELLGAMGSTIALLEARRARWCKRAVDAERSVREFDKDRRSERAEREALEHKLWAMLGGPATPGEDVAERVRQELEQQRSDEKAQAVRLEAIVAEVWSVLGIEPGASAVLPACVAALKTRIVTDQAAALAECAEAMSIWGRWGDGVPDAGEPGEYGRVGKAYDEACRITGITVPRPHVSGVPRSAPKTCSGTFSKPCGDPKCSKCLMPF